MEIKGRKANKILRKQNKLMMDAVFIEMGLILIRFLIKITGNKVWLLLMKIKFYITFLRHYQQGRYISEV